MAVLLELQRLRLCNQGPGRDITIFDVLLLAHLQDKRRAAEAESKRGKGKPRGGKQRGKVGRGPGVSNGSAAILPSPLPPLLPTPSESLHIMAEADGRPKRRPNAVASEWPPVLTPISQPAQKPVLPGTGVFHAGDEDPKQGQAEAVRKRGGLTVGPSDPPLAATPVRPSGAAWGRSPGPETPNGPPPYNPLVAPVTPLQQWAPVAYPALPASLDDFHSAEGGSSAGQNVPLWMDPAERPPSAHQHQGFAALPAAKYSTPGSSSFFQSATQDTVITPFPRLPSPQASVASSAEWNTEGRPSSGGLAPLRTSRPSSSAGLFPEAVETGSPSLSPQGHVLHSILSDLLPDSSLGTEEENGAESQSFDLNGEGITDTPAGVHLPAGLLASDDPVSSSPRNLTFGSLPADLGDLGAESVHPLPSPKADPGHLLGNFWPDYRPSPEDLSPGVASSPGLPAHLQNSPYMASPYGYPGQGHLAYNSPMPNMYSGHPIFDSYPGGPQVRMTPGEGEISHSLFSAVQQGGHLSTPSYAPQQHPDRPGSGSAQRQDPSRMLFMEDPCSICLDRQKNCALLPCGHRACGVCSQQMHMRRMLCPMCNRSIEGVLQLFH
jgi:hypothetical protein